MIERQEKGVRRWPEAVKGILRSVFSAKLQVFLKIIFYFFKLELLGGPT